MIFDSPEDKAIKAIFKAFTNWSYTSSCSDDKVYWEVNFKEVDSAIDLEMLRRKIYDLPFEPAANLGRNSTATFYGLYNTTSLRKELELADYAA